MIVHALNKIFPFLSHKKEQENTNPSTNENCLHIGLNFVFLLGFSFVFSGVIFFFAFNWHAMPDYLKFTLIQIALCICTLTAYMQGPHSTIGTWALTASSMLVGIFLAVFGQVYQSNSDSYTLFLLWAITILPFVYLAQFSLLWIIFLLLLNISFYLSWDILSFYFEHNDQIFYILFTTLNASFLTLRELSIKKIPCLKAYALRLLLYCFILIGIGGQVLSAMGKNTLFSFYTCISVLYFFLCFAMYRYLYKDILLTALSLITACFLVVAYFLHESQLTTTSYMLLALLVTALCIALAKYMEKLYKKIRTRPQAQENTHATQQTLKTNPLHTAKKHASVASSLRTLICSFSAVLSTGILTIAVYLWYEASFQNTYFLSCIGIVSLLLSLLIFQQKDKANAPPSYVKLYLALTALLLGYLLITAAIKIEHEMANTTLALLITPLTLCLYPYVSHFSARVFIGIYTAACVYINTEFPLPLLLLTLLLLSSMTICFFQKAHHKKEFALIGFAILTLLVFGMLADKEQYFFSLEYISYFSILLALWTSLLALLFLRKNTLSTKTSSLQLMSIYALAALCLFFCTYIHAYAVLYIMGMLALSLYGDKAHLLQKTIYISIPILILYYYNLDITLLQKSYTLLLSGGVLLLFFFYSTRSLIHEK